MQQIPFTKMHGLGNCYVYVNGFEVLLQESQLPRLAMRISEPNVGIGSDGLILILPSKNADVKMRIFNKDGSEAKNCGNGLRCVAKFAYEHGLVDEKIFEIETLSGIVQAKVHVSGKQVHEVTINMGVPKWTRGSLPMKEGHTEESMVSVPIEVVSRNKQVMTGVSMGNPHGVFFVDQIEKAPIEVFGPILADDHPLFPEGLNVEFVEMLSQHEMEFRVWERGSGITQACGTGACAAVVAAVLNNKTKQDQEVTVHLLGGDLKVRWCTDGAVFMTGPAVTICNGEYFPEMNSKA